MENAKSYLDTPPPTVSLSFASLREMLKPAVAGEVPSPDDEVPKHIRDEFFTKMKSKASERVRTARQQRACGEAVQLCIQSV